MKCKKPTPELISYLVIILLILILNFLKISARQPATLAGKLTPQGPHTLISKVDALPSKK